MCICRSADRFTLEGLSEREFRDRWKVKGYNYGLDVQSCDLATGMATLASEAMQPGFLGQRRSINA